MIARPLKNRKSYSDNFFPFYSSYRLMCPQTPDRTPDLEAEDGGEETANQNQTGTNFQAGLAARVGNRNRL